MRSSLTVRMDEHFHRSLFLPTIATVCLLFLTTLPQSHCAPQQPDTKYSVCKQPFNCGGVSNISYPFWDEGGRPRYCGGIDQFKLSNCDPDELPSIKMGLQVFHVLAINTAAYTMKMVQMDYVGYGHGYDVCSSPPSANNSLNSTLFQYTQNVHSITIFDDCPPYGHYPSGGNNITCSDNGNWHNFYWGEETLLQQFPGLQKCKDRIQVQVSQDVPLDPGGGIEALYQALSGGFEVNYTIEDPPKCETCWKSNGICGRDDSADYVFSCHCPDGSDALECSLSSDHNSMPSFPSSHIFGFPDSSPT